MGNGRRGRSSGIALGSMFVLLLAGMVMLGPGSRPHAQKAIAQLPASPISRFSRASLSPSSLRSSSVHARPDARALLGQLPMIFEPNQGQADAGVKFLARGAGYGLFLEPTSAVLALRTAPSSKSESAPKNNEQFVRMKLVGASSAAATVGTDPLPGKTNYMIGNDPKQWHNGIPQFGGVRYANVYPGIDLVFYGSQGNLEYDFKVAPGADTSRAELQFDGASQLKLDGGDLILTGDGGLRLQAPNIYQRDGNRRKPIAGRFVLHADNRVGFEIGTYDHSRELVIDPVLQFSTYFGGAGAVSMPSIAVSGSYIYLAGSTTSATGFPGGATPTLIGAGTGIFVAKILPSQPPSVAYLTFLGGTGSDTSIGVGADNGGKAYIVGNTTSTNFPTSNTNVLGYQTNPATKGSQCAAPVVCKSVFVTALNATGASLFYSSYLSGNGDDEASGMTIDLSGDVFITGTTTSNDVPSLTDAFPATNLPQPFQTQPISTIQFFVTKLNTSVAGPSGVAYSTYFGGSTPASPVAVGGGIAVDSNGNIYFTGTTNFYNSGAGSYGNSQSSDFPILNAYQPCLDTIPPTVLGVMNPCSNTSLTTPYPTDAFLAKLNPNAAAGSQLLFSTYLGGAGNDTSTAVAIDSGAANIYLTGSTNSSNFTLPTGTAAFQNCLDNPAVTTCPTPAPTNTDAYVARFNNPTLSTTGTPNNVGLTYFSYLGGSLNDSGTAVAVLNASNTTLGDVLVTGTTSSTDFPVTAGAIQSTLGTGATQNAFFAQIDTTPTTGNNRVGSYATYFGGDHADIGTSLAVDTSQNTYLAGQTTSDNLQLANNFTGPGGASLNGTQDAFVLKLGSAADLAIQAPTISPSGIVSAGNTVATTFNIANQGPDPATNITVTALISPGMVFNTATAGSGTCSTPSGSSAVCTIPALQSGSTSAAVFTTTPSTNGNFLVTATVSSSNNTSAIQPDSSTATFTAGTYSLAINPPARSVVAGTIVPYTVTLTPNPLFVNTVSLSCGSLPSGATCNFAPSATVTLNGPQSVTLNLGTTPQPVNTASSGGWRSPLYALGLMIPGMAVLGLGTRGKRRGKLSRMLGLLALCVLFTLVLLQPACSGNKTQPTVSGTPSGVYSLTVTATSGSFSRTVPFNLTVTP